MNEKRFSTCRSEISQPKLEKKSKTNPVLVWYTVMILYDIVQMAANFQLGVSTGKKAHSKNIS